MPRRSHPLLASDVVRAYLGLALLFPIIFVTGFATAYLFAASVPERVLTLGVVFIGWTSICVLFVIMILFVFLPAGPAELRRWLRETTPTGRWRTILWSINGGGAIYWAGGGTFLTVAALISIVANEPEVRGHPLILSTGIAVVIGSFALIVVSYALRYAREDAVRGGPVFPGTDNPRFADYLYLAAQVSTTFGGSDVELTTTPMRRLVTVHSLLAFAFNTVIVALLVSVLLNAIS